MNWIWMASAAAGSGCEAPIGIDTLEAQLEQAERALGDLNSDGFLSQTADLAARVECVEGAVPPKVAAHVHRVFGLRAYLGRQDADARAAFSSARAVDPDYVFPFWLLPERHAIREVYAEAEPDLAVLPVLPARNGELRFDGRPIDERPQLRPTVVQVLGNDGAVVATRWLRPADGLPPYDASRPVLPPLIGSKRTLRTTLLVSGIAAGVLAAGSYGVAGVANAGFQKAENRDEVFGNQRLANAMVYTSGISGGVAVVSLTGAFLVGRF